MPRDRKRAAGTAADPTGKGAAQGQRKRMRVGDGIRGKRNNARAAIGKSEEDSEYTDQSDGEEVDLDLDEAEDENDDEDEDEDDDGEAEATRKALRDLQAAMERTEKRDNYAKEFEKCISEEERRLVGLMDSEVREREAASQVFRSHIVSLLSTALAPTGTKTSGTPSGPSGLTSKVDAQKLVLEDVPIGKHPLYHRSQALLQCSESLIQEYDKLSTFISDLEAPADPAEMWERDCAETRRVIAIGVAASQAEIERLLVRKDDTRERKIKEKLASKQGKGLNGNKEKRSFENDQQLQDMLKMGKGKENLHKEPYGWGKVAHQVVKGMKVLIKAFPVEREG
ncbi:hypothetical protein PAAG_00970 [Paracoccidioides lutzii Pb01]|uniref:Uncharacterized protein n=1 Tax=Paracoccidioides lutzii (strain ATCC MYA-826 / Pb01) TaxID=502779 RepID=C1GR25_PARBA|nr:hypothetical protein PAAG_00970 [Paracoccidioides lutzii Pb01]EEH38049.2 hypothetical protein PAAG_00970 [Paracoccidioides lutzii Pb01]